MTIPHGATATQQFATCPTKWDYERQGWRPAVARYMDVVGAIGTAIHAATALYDGGLEATDAIMADEERTLETALTQLATFPHENARTSDAFETATERFRAGFLSYIEQNPLDGFEILDIELVLPKYGHSTIDRGVRTPSGALAVVDIKTKRFSSGYYKRQFLDEYGMSSQLRHYVAGYENHKNEHVNVFYLLSCDLLPRVPRWDLAPYQVDELRVAHYLTTATEYWDTMTRIVGGEERPKRAIVCHDRFGPCPFFNACWRYDGNEYAMTSEYVQLKQRETVERNEALCLSQKMKP